MAMYFDGNTLITLLSDADAAATYAPAIAIAIAIAIAAAGPRYTSPLAVIEAAAELPELGEAGVTAFLGAQGIELRDLPPSSRLITGALAAEGKLKARRHGACATYYETEIFELPAGEPAAPQTE